MPAFNSIAGRIRHAACIAVLLALAGCAHVPANPPQPWRDAGQLVLVTVADWNADHGQLRSFERDDAGQWVQVGTTAPVVIGRAGAGWGRGLHPMQPDGPTKQEGDGRAPAGVFAISQAFGYGPHATTALPYTGMDAGDYCIDVSTSPLYNRIVDTAVVGEAAIEGSTEPMRRDIHAGGDQRYRIGFVVEHNPQAVPAAGSCIFAHVWKSPTTPTAGCTAMDAAVMERLLAWLRPDADPVFVLLPQAQYLQLRGPWALPGDAAGATPADSR